MNSDFIKALDVLEKEKKINKEELIEAIETSIASSYTKNYGNQQEVRVEINRENGEIAVFSARRITEVVEDPKEEIAYERTKEINPLLKIGDIFQEKITPKDFGRIAAQNAKQLIVQRIKEAERNMIYQEFLENQDEIVTGIVTRVDRGYVYVDIGNGEAIMMPSEQTTGEEYFSGQRLKVYMLMVKKTTKGPHVNVSRTHPGLVKRLFEAEVPEIYDGIVDIVSISREAGSRTKVAVNATDPAIDAVGACVGQRGVRVLNIINELNGEKIDIIKYSDNVEEYLSNALSPAKVVKVVVNKIGKTAIAIVDDMQLSLAIGKEGQNVRLAAKMTNWKIDIKSSSDYEKLISKNPNFEQEYRGIVDESKCSNTASLNDILSRSIDETEERTLLNDVLDDLVASDEF